MPWPQALEYNEAIQCPSACFRDPELRQTQVFTNALGMPSPHSGNFADVYKMEGPGGAAWAVKCFTRAVNRLHERYQAISDHLRDDPRPFMVDFQYLEGGIRIGSSWYPTVKMRWVEGFTLNEFIRDHIEERPVMERLAELFLKLSVQLREAGIAHGDLQHGNVMLVPGTKANSLSLKLIDYDGICVPGLIGRPSGEFGHPNYQHPERSPQGRGTIGTERPPENGYGPDMDRFSLLSIYTALRALALDGRGLWRAFDCGENLLFRDVDFREPGESSLFKRLWTDFGGDVRSLTARTLLASQGAFADVPLLAELIEGGKVEPLSREQEERVAELLGIKVEAPAPAPTRPRPVQPTAAPLTAAPPTPRPANRPATAIVVPAHRAPNPTPAPDVPVPTAEQRRAAAGQFERANQVIATGNYEYGLKLLLTCCRLDPANLIYRQALRRTEKAKYKNNLRGGWLAWLTTWPAKARVKRALHAGDFIKVLDLGEKVLLRNPWEVGTQIDMAAAADELGLVDLAVWSLEQARQKEAAHPAVNRALALLYEKRGNFTQAMALWALVRKARPADQEADQKLKDLAVSDTIQRGNYDTSPVGRNGADEEGSPSPKPSKTVPAGARGEGAAAGTAADPLRRRIETNPTDPRGYLQLAQYHRRSNELELARAVLEVGLGPTGNAFELIVELSEMEIEPFRKDLVITEDKLTTAPDNAELRQHRARLKKEIGTRELDLYRRKADRSPNEAGLRLEVGIRLLAIGQLDEAIRELQTVRNDSRYAGKAAHYLGQCFVSRKNSRLAQRNFEEALQHLAPSDNELRKETTYHLAKICAETGDLARAVDLAADLAHEDYAFRDVGSLLDEWQTRLQEKV